MLHDRQYFISEVDKIRGYAVSRAWKAPPQVDASFIFRSDEDPQDVNVEAWANALLHIETRQHIPLTISGGGYGCFTFSATTSIEHADRFVKAMETDLDLQGFLNRAGAKLVEVWKHIRGNSNLEIVVPRYRYKTIVATNRAAATSRHISDRVELDLFSRDTDGDLVTGTLDVWVYDPRASAQRPGIAKRIWRKLQGGLRSAETPDISWSDLQIANLPDIVDGITPAFHESRPRFSVFVHGYATTLNSAVELFGNFIHQVRYDQIGTVPILFSWPSYGVSTAYLSDAPRAERSEQKLAQLMTGLASKEAPAPTVDVLAHSHGTKLTFGSVLMNAKVPSGRHAATLGNLIFVAPDMDAKLFVQHVPDLRAKTKHITVYHSRGDIALTISGWLQSRRLGKRPLAPSSQLDDIDIIDASHLNADWLGHSYHVGCPEMHHDIRGLLEGAPAHLRQLLQRDVDDPRIWRLLPVR